MTIALDTETCAWLDRPGWKAPPMVCLSLSDGASAHVIHRTDDWIPIVRAALAEGIVGHHVAFDMCVIAAAGFPLEEIFEAYADDRITCTMAREKLADIATGEMAKQRKPRGPGYGLDVLCKRRLGVELDKSSVRLEYERLLNVPVAQWPEAFREYAANDALYTWRLHAAQADHPDEYRQARAAFWIQLMSTWGTCVDLPRLHELRERYEADFEIAGADLVEAGLARVVIKKGESSLVRNVKIVGERIVQAYAKQGKPHPETKHHAPQTDENACAESGDPTLLRYSEYMGLQTKVRKEIPALDKPLIHAYFDSLVETGRTACGGPNLQNLPRDGGFRQCLIPRPGNVYVCADYAGFELSTWAQVCLDLVGFSKLAEEINADRDPHLEIAAEILGWSYEACDAVRKAGKGHPDWKRVDNARQVGKVLNFGAPGGIGPKRLAASAPKYGITMSEAEAKRLKESVWLPRRPEAVPYFDKINWAVETHGAVEQLYSGRVRGDVSYTDACNGLFQGLAADIAKDAGFQLSRECYVGNLAGCRIVNFVHDEYVVEVPEEYAKGCAKLIEYILTNAAKPWLPGVKLGVEVTISRRYKGDYL